MSQRNIETLIGRLITDELFRAEFLKDPRGVLGRIQALGLELNATESLALLNTDPALWAMTAEALDPRLQKASFRNADHDSKPSTRERKDKSKL